MFNERDRRCAAVQLMLSIDPNKTTGPLPAPSKCKSGRFNVPRVMKTKFPATVIVFGVLSSEGHIMPPHIFEVGLKVNTKVYLDVLKSVVILGAIRWPVPDPGCGSRTRHRPTSPKKPRLGFRRSATTLQKSRAFIWWNPSQYQPIRNILCINYEFKSFQFLLFSVCTSSFCEKKIASVLPFSAIPNRFFISYFQIKSLFFLKIYYLYTHRPLTLFF